MMITVIISIDKLLGRGIFDYSCLDELSPWNWDRIRDVFKLVNKTCDTHATWLLSLCYMPGCIAGYIQLIK